MGAKGHEIAKSKAAGMAAATRGRSRRFADKADLLEQARREDDDEVEAGVEEWKRRRLYQKLKQPCDAWESCQVPEEKSSVCFHCGWLKKHHVK